MADKKLTDTKVKGYEIVVSGQYYSRDTSTGIKTVKFYKDEKFFFPKIVTYTDGKQKVTRMIEGIERSVSVPKVVRANALRVCQHLIRRHHIEDRLKEKYEDYLGVRLMEIFSKDECEIDPALEIDITKKPIKEMTRSEISQIVVIRDLNIVLGNYADLGDMKMAVSEAIKQKETDDAAAGRTEAMSEEEEMLTEPESSSLFG